MLNLIQRMFHTHEWQIIRADLYYPGKALGRCKCGKEIEITSKDGIIWKFPATGRGEKIVYK